MITHPNKPSSLDAAYERQAIEQGMVDPAKAVFPENRTFKRITEPTMKPTGDTVSPWQPMTMSRDIKSIGKLLEELGECSSAASRCLIQGLYDSEPLTGKVNKEWLEEEIADVLANFDIVVERFNLTIDPNRITKKRLALQKWHDL